MTTLSDYQNLHLELHMQQPELQNYHKNCTKPINQEGNAKKKKYSFPRALRFRRQKELYNTPGPGQYTPKKMDQLDVLATKWKYPISMPLFKKEVGRGLDSNMFLF